MNTAHLDHDRAAVAEWIRCAIADAVPYSYTTAEIEHSGGGCTAAVFTIYQNSDGIYTSPVATLAVIDRGQSAPDDWAAPMAAVLVRGDAWQNGDMAAATVAEWDAADGDELRFTLIDNLAEMVRHMRFPMAPPAVLVADCPPHIAAEMATACHYDYRAQLWRDGQDHAHRTTAGNWLFCGADHASCSGAPQ